MNMNSTTHFKIIKTSLIFAALFGLNACSSDNSSTTVNGRGADETLTKGTLTISLTDAAVDSAQEVLVQFNGVSIKPSDGDAFNILFDDVKNIDLLSLQGTKSADLISNRIIPPGSYDWIRLLVNAEQDGINDSYIRLNDGSIHEFSIPSGSQTGLKINYSFELTTIKALSLMIDFDLRKSVVLSSGEYKLRPTLRMVDMADVGSISGTIESELVTATNCSDTDPATYNVVYLFEGHNVIPDDLDNKKPEALTSDIVELNLSSGLYEYEIGFIPTGDYTIAFTCQSDLDTLKNNEEIVFSLVDNITVISDENDILINPVR